MASVYGVEEFLSMSSEPNTGSPLADPVGDRERTSETCWGTIFMYPESPQVNTTQFTLLHLIYTND